MSQESEHMYELEFPAPQVSPDGAEGPTLVVALQGYADAGQAVDSSAQHLRAALDNAPVAHFHNDELIDYRSRRPAVMIDHNEVIDGDDLRLAIDVLRDTNQKPFLLLSGPEPDMRWDGFTNAVADLVEKFGVQQTICLYAAPMAVPHTRPMVISAHGNDQKLMSNQFTLDTKITVPGSAALHLERLLNKRGLNVAGYTAHVPHYLAASPYPQATLRLLEAVASTAELDFPLGALEADAERIAEQIEEQVTASPEIQQVVGMLEQQYDEELERYRERNPQAVMPGESSVPSGDELGDEFEQFLAALDDHALEKYAPADGESEVGSNDHESSFNPNMIDHQDDTDNTTGESDTNN